MLCQGNPYGSCGANVNHFVTIISVGISTAFPHAVKRPFAILFVIGLVSSALQCATLEHLALTDIIGKSTAIVRARVTGSSVAKIGPVIYTHYQLQVSEQYKGTAESSVDLAFPGGALGGIQQVYSGVPQLHSGEEYVFFLWTGKSGVTQVIGLTQGLFAVSYAGVKDPSLVRAASHETMIERGTGRHVQDQTLTMTLSALKSQISAVLGQQGNR
jgi:hypothetical protein